MQALAPSSRPLPPGLAPGSGLALLPPALFPSSSPRRAESLTTTRRYDFTNLLFYPDDRASARPPTLCEVFASPRLFCPRDINTVTYTSFLIISPPRTHGHYAHSRPTRRPNSLDLRSAPGCGSTEGGRILRLRFRPLKGTLTYMSILSIPPPPGGTFSMFLQRRHRERRGRFTMPPRRRQRLRAQEAQARERGRRAQQRGEDERETAAPAARLDGSIESGSTALHGAGASVDTLSSSIRRDVSHRTKDRHKKMKKMI